MQFLWDNISFLWSYKFMQLTAFKTYGVSNTNHIHWPKSWLIHTINKGEIFLTNSVDFFFLKKKKIIWLLKSNYYNQNLEAVYFEASWLSIPGSRLFCQILLQKISRVYVWREPACPTGIPLESGGITPYRAGFFSYKRGSLPCQDDFFFVMKSF